RPDAAVRPRQPVAQRLAAIGAGIVEDDMDQALVRVGPLEPGEELDRGLGGDPDVLDDLAVAGLQAERAGEVHPLAALAAPDRRLLALADPAMGGPALVFRVHRIGEIDGLVGREAGEQPFVARDDAWLAPPPPRRRAAPWACAPPRPAGA